MKPETIPQKRRRERYPSRAFSLIEVTMALGIVSVAFIALLGLLPIGLNTFTRSIDSATQSQIAQAILTEARQARFSDLVAFSNDNNQFNYDEQGKRVTNASKRVYFADISKGDIKVTFHPSMQVGDDADSGSSTPDGMNVAVVSITVRKISAPDEKRTAVAYIANNGL